MGECSPIWEKIAQVERAPLLHTALSVYRVCYFLVPHTHVLCMGSGSATGFFYQVRLVHSLLKYFFKFQLWYWIQIYTTKYSNLLLIILILLVWIACSTYRKGEILMQKWHVCHQPICLLLHAILSGVGVHKAMHTMYELYDAYIAIVYQFDNGSPLLTLLIYKLFSIILIMFPIISVKYGHCTLMTSFPYYNEIIIFLLTAISRDLRWRKLSWFLSCAVAMRVDAFIRT